MLEEKLETFVFIDKRKPRNVLEHKCRGQRFSHDSQKGAESICARIV
jgi:hypothetical protein